MRAANLDYFWNVVSFVGLYAQVGITLLLVLFLVLLSRHVGRDSHYFVTWTRGWVAMTLAITLLAVGFLGIPHVTAPGDSSSKVWFPATYLGYQFGKLSYLLLLLAGTLELETGRLSRALLTRGAALVAIYTLLSFGLSGDFNVIIVWEAVAFTVVCAYMGWRLLRLWRIRGGLGVRIVTVSFSAMAVTWAFYAVAFYVAVTSPMGWSGNGFIFSATKYNSFYDLLLEILFAFGMVMMLQEDARHELGSAHQKLLNESLTDPLTGCYNRLAFTRGSLLQAADTSRGAVVLFDLDNLKQVNDAHGHEAGDGLLRHFTAVLRSGSRPADQLYRWGGDEFLLLVPGAQLAALAPRLEALLRDAPACGLGEGKRELRLQVSWGGADYPSAAGLRGAVQEADSAMYQHKRSRKTRTP